MSGISTDRQSCPNALSTKRFRKKRLDLTCVKATGSPQDYYEEAKTGRGGIGAKSWACGLGGL